MRLVVATHARETKTSLFLALSAIDNVSIVATANSTGEMISYCRTLRPDVVIIEGGLPGHSLDKAVDQIDDSMSEGRILIVDGVAAQQEAAKRSHVEQFDNLDVLVEACSGPESLEGRT